MNTATLPASSHKQDARVNAAFDGDLPFTSHDLLDDANRADLQKWVDDDELVGLVDEASGGIIGYVNRAHADRIAALLNAAASENV